MLFPLRDRNPTRRPPLATYTLLAVNLIAFVWMSRLPQAHRQVFAYEHGFVPARIAQLFRPEPIIVQIPQHEIATPFGQQVVVAQYALAPEPGQILLSLLTSMFLHGGWWHLIGNMWFLWIFGNNVEDRLGPWVYVLFYLAGGLLASGFQWAAGPHHTAPIIGASGAVAAVLGAYAITWPWARVQTLVFLFVFVSLVDLPALLVLGFWFVGQLLEATRVMYRGQPDLVYNTGVAWWAHVGGFLAGLLVMPPLSELVRSMRAARPRRLSGPPWESDPPA
ncbi:MAG: rhomboid family intramembrane serine protease [Thermoguttaceae bacterium]